MSSEHFTVTVGEREYRVELTAEGKPVGVTIRITRHGGFEIRPSHTRRIFPMEYRDLPGPTTSAAIQAAQVAQRQTRTRPLSEGKEVSSV
jgi:hypothetical protein